MVIDTSSVAAVLFNEPEGKIYEEKIASDPVRLISAASIVEAAMVIESRKGDAGGRELDRWLHRIGAEIVSVDVDQAATARGAWRRYGKGRSPASLNYGDCFAYALSVSRGEPLLSKGSDFAKTDVV